MDGVFLRHTRIAIGSLAELETQIEIATRLGLTSADVVRALENQMKRTGQLLHGLRRMLRATAAKPVKQR
jgi:four helix bundle protein